MVYPKMTIISSFTHVHVIMNLYDFLLSVKYKKRCFKECARCIFPIQWKWMETRDRPTPKKEKKSTIKVVLVIAEIYFKCSNATWQLCVTADWQLSHYSLKMLFIFGHHLLLLCSTEESKSFMFWKTRRWLSDYLNFWVNYVFRELSYIPHDYSE